MLSDQDSSSEYSAKGESGSCFGSNGSEMGPGGE